ncbi:MAG: S8 family serine peptidase, partial [Chloroflexota bacterium]|nr:S8 family serine peptidase [Chloroflexota bacterium]
MDKLTSALLSRYRNKAVTPVIIESAAGAFSNMRASLRQIVPVDLLETQFHTFLPRVMGVIEVSLTKFKEITSFNMIGTTLSPDLIEEVAQFRSVKTIYPDNFVWASSIVPQAGIYKDRKGKDFTSTLWTKRLLGLDVANSKGFTGNGITAAVLDTGARKTHEMLHRVQIHTAMAEKGGSGLDGNGHGTYCNSTVGGVHATDRRYNVPVEGMAPSCNLLSIQCLGFIIGMGMDSDIIKAMEMATKMGSKVVSMSLGGDTAPKDSENPEAKAINDMASKGIIPCIAAGNSGPKSSTVGTPGSCLNSLTVGAWNELKGGIADFSSRGPTSGDGYIKPDVVAPGVRIDSALVGYLDAEVDPSGPKYGSISGTSMATPHCAGLVTCMAQLYRERVGKELT